MQDPLTIAATNLALTGGTNRGHGACPMPQLSAQRRSPRHDIVLPLLHRATPAALRVGVGWTRNLSEGGACLELTVRLPPQAPLWVHLQTDRGTIEAKAQVAWTGAPDSARGSVLHGVAFTQMSPAQRRVLRDMLLSKSDAGQVGSASHRTSR